MSWITTNLPLLSGIAVAFLSFLSSFIEFFRERNSENKKIKKVKEFTDIYSSLPETVEAKENVGLLLTQLTKELLEQNNRKINKSTIFAIIFIALVGGGLSYLLASWATISNGIFAFILWLAFGIVILFTIALSITGWASRYNEDKNQKVNKNK